MKRGFTLVELLAIIIVLGILAAIVTSSVTGIINKTREATYDEQIKALEGAAERWAESHDIMLPDIGSSDVMVINFDTLISSGELKKQQIINPKTNEDLEGCILVGYNQEYNRYEYTYNSDESRCK